MKVYLVSLKVRKILEDIYFPEAERIKNIAVFMTVLQLKLN